MSLIRCVFLKVQRVLSRSRAKRHPLRLPDSAAESWLRPLPVANASEVVSLRSVSPSMSSLPMRGPGGMSYPDFEDFRDNNRSFDSEKVSGSETGMDRWWKLSA